ncbi:MAG TPA: hypothetical protein VF713_24140 [Thermoanaerobaculia bacterium]
MTETKIEESADPVETEEDPWARYERVKLTPEQVAKGRTELQKEIDRALAEGVYEKLIEWRARRVANAESEEPEREDPWARYERMKLTPEKVAQGRAELQRRIDKARAAGVYEELMKWKGKVHWDIDIDALREDRD